MAAADRYRSGRDAAFFPSVKFFVMNWQSAESLDGQYFGPIPASAVIGQVIPACTEEE
jgi:type IV secretory pathway protease TraF